MSALCKAVGCVRHVRAAGYCGMHYQRVQKYGVPGEPGPRKPEVRGGCVVEGCDGAHTSHGYCQPHAYRFKKYGDPLGGSAYHKAPSASSYGAMHRALRIFRGRAGEHACTGCGGQAEQWAYDHRDPGELHEDVRSRDGSSRSVAWSKRPEHYHPLCMGCHTKLDTHGTLKVPERG